MECDSLNAIFAGSMELLEIQSRAPDIDIAVALRFSTGYLQFSYYPD